MKSSKEPIIDHFNISRDHGAAAQLLCALVTRAATGVPASFLQNKNVEKMSAV